MKTTILKVKFNFNLHKHSTILAKPWYHTCNLPRDHITSFSRMRSNHYNLAFSLFRKNLTDSPECLCGDIEDLNHVFLSCPRYDTQCVTLTRSLIKQKIFPPYIISQFLHAPKPYLISLLCGFLKSCEFRL